MRSVRGILFVDYVRMVRAQGLGATKKLTPEDVALAKQRIDPKGWYPMDAFERMGLAILDGVVGQELESIRMWGRYQVSSVAAQFPEMLHPEEPRETMLRTGVLMSSFFDFPAVEMKSLGDTSASVQIAYGMSEPAERAASWQSMGFFEGLLGMAGAHDIHADFSVMSWHEGQGPTRLELVWSLG
jgi:hypothetical protein